MGYFVQNSILESTPEYSRSGAAATSLIYDRQGKRKYITISERRAFLEAALKKSPEVYAFCLTLAYTGARISEVLALTPSRVDAEARVIVFESLKKRRRGVFRAVPVPMDLLRQLDRTYDIMAMRRNEEHADGRIWAYSRTTAWNYVRACLRAANVVGPQASPKGFRHSFVVFTLQAGAPLPVVQRWVGHARISTTALYAEAVGEEEQAIADRFWTTFR